MNRTIANILLCVALVANTPCGFAQSAAFTYQGRLSTNGIGATGLHDFRFTLYDGAAGSAVAGPITNSSVAVTNGLFSAAIDFGLAAFDGSPRWLQIEARPSGGSAFTTLSPRQQITAAPYAITALTVPVNSISGNNLQNGSVTALKIAASSVGPTQLAQNSVGTFNIADGSITAADISSSAMWPGFLGLGSVGAGQIANSAVSTSQIRDNSIAAVDVVSNTFWQTSGNSDTTPGVHFVGTSDKKALEFRVNNQRALRIEPVGDSVWSPDGLPDGAPNIIGGSAFNAVASNVVGATIAGGGATNYSFTPYTNFVSGDFGTVSGGAGNALAGTSFAAAIGGGLLNFMDSAAYSFIGSGENNRIGTYSDHSVIAGGFNNAIGSNALLSFIGGGIANLASDDAPQSVIGGGAANRIRSGSFRSAIAGGSANRVETNSAWAAISGGVGNAVIGAAGAVPGGSNNVAGTLAFAAGRRALATNMGSFVWADSQDADFASSAANQFLVRAAGGVGINSRSPQAHLHVYSVDNPTSVRIQSSGTPGFSRLEFVSDPQGSANEWRPGYIQSTDAGGFTGGLTFNVNGTGAANKFATQEVMRMVNGRVGIMTNNPQTALHVVGTVSATAFNPSSDRELKENFKPVDARSVLDKVVALPITQWNFKGDTETRHMGTMAQDFRESFGLGTDEKHIATVDADGVALAAIQGLNEVVKEKDARIAALERTVAELKAAVEKLGATR